jgi:type 1 glutamine amidotransferase
VSLVVPTTRAAAVLVLAVAAALLGGGSGPAATGPPELRILLFTKTAGFRHDSIPTAVQALRDLGARNHIEVDAAEDAAVFTDQRLRRYDVVVLLLTTGDILDDRQQAAFQRYIRSGGGFAGVHSASDTEHDWPWYGGLVGAYFRAHPQIQQATVAVSDPRDASTRGLPRLWQRTDEWYGFATSPRGSVRVLATLDEASYAPGDSAMGGDHPIAWSHLYEGGRAWYTAGGHTRESYTEASFRGHLLGGILWAAGPPTVNGLRGVARNGRLVVTGTAARCVRCSAWLRVRVGGRSAVTTLRMQGGTFAGTTGVLPRGRWPYGVTVSSDASGLRTTRAGVVRIR